MKYIIPFLVFLIYVGCKEKEEDTLMTYNISQCADPWINADYYKNKEAALRTFLESKSIKVISLSIALDQTCASGVTCAACTCPSCYIASVLVPFADITKMEALKFKKSF
jgi:hypothetical protein